MPPYSSADVTAEGLSWSLWFWLEVKLTAFVEFYLQDASVQSWTAPQQFPSFLFPVGFLCSVLEEALRLCSLPLAVTVHGSSGSFIWREKRQVIKVSTSPSRCRSGRFCCLWLWCLWAGLAEVHVSTGAGLLCWVLHQPGFGELIRGLHRHHDSTNQTSCFHQAKAFKSHSASFQLELLFFPNFFLSHADQYRWWVKRYVFWENSGWQRFEEPPYLSLPPCSGTRRSTSSVCLLLDPLFTVWRSGESGSWLCYRWGTDPQIPLHHFPLIRSETRGVYSKWTPDAICPCPSLPPVDPLWLAERLLDAPYPPLLPPPSWSELRMINSLKKGSYSVDLISIETIFCFAGLEVTNKSIWNFWIFLATDVFD